jgi:hypothetical protein
MKLKHLILLTLLIVFALASLIIFLSVPLERLETGVFILSFILAVPVNLIAAVCFVFWAFSKSTAEFVKHAASFIIIATFSPVLLVAGLALIYSDVVNVVTPIIVFAAIAVAYFVFALYTTFSAGYMTSTEKHVQSERRFLKLLELDILDCAAKTTNTVTEKALRDFAESVRHSDPMSHESLNPIENDLSSLVYEISASISSAPAADMLDKIRRAEVLLASRNNRCMMLK